MKLAGILGAGPEPRRRLLLPGGALTGILMVLSFPLYGVDLLIWVALVPLLLAATGAGARRGFLAGWFAGLTLVSGGFIWVLHSMREFTGLGRAAGFLFWPWLLYESLPWGLLGLVLGTLRGAGGPAPGRVFAAVPIWVGIEHLYPHVFPWHVGGALHARAWLVQCADLLGASGLTALVFLVNAVLYRLVLWLRQKGRFPSLSLATAALLLLGANLYGALRLGQVESALASAPELEVGLIQPVVRPEEKRGGKRGDGWLVFEKMETLTRALEQKGPLDLVVWPEGMDTVGWLFNSEGNLVPRQEMNRQRRTGFENLKTPLVAGSGSISEASGLSRNTAAFVLPWNPVPAGFYHKNVRVPFGEYVPLLDHLPAWLRDQIRNVGTIEAGSECPLLTLAARGRQYRFRILICYEAVLPGFVRRQSELADFLVNVTEDIWYGDTAHIPQHLSVLALRAVEGRISIVRAANVGPSGVVDPSGRMAEHTRAFEKAERAFTLRPARLGSLYLRGGYMFPEACLAGGIIWLWFLLSGREKSGESAGKGLVIHPQR